MDAIEADYLDHMPLVERQWLLLRKKWKLGELGASSINSGASKVEWPGLPRGTKFDPSDADLLWHLIAKIGNGIADASPHPLIHEFIQSLDEFAEFNHMHPQNLPGVQQDGTASYFFHKPLIKHFDSFQKHYIWHTEAEAKPVYLDGVHQGFKKVYTLLIRTDGGKPEKSDWVLHQYHACSDERDSQLEGELVVSKLYRDVKSKHVALQACKLNQGTSLACRSHNMAATGRGLDDGKDGRSVVVKDADQGHNGNLGDSSDHMPLKKRNYKRQEQKKPAQSPEASVTPKEIDATDCNSSRTESVIAGSNFTSVQSSQTTSLDHVSSNLNLGNLHKIKPEPVSDFDEMALDTKAEISAHAMVTIEQVELEEKVPLIVLQSMSSVSRATNVPFSGQSDSFPKSSAPVPASRRPRKSKKTATDSVEEALEEDAPGLLKVLVDRGIIADEIKLYGVGEDDTEPLELSSDNDFQDLESVITKFLSDRASLLKITTAKCKKGEKTVYCLACLISLIEQTRYLKLHKSPVEWGWCRDLQSFIFVFQHHNRIVLERPEYGFATYFFELIPSLPTDWQIKRLITAMKINSRASLLENKPLLVGEDLTEGEARVLEGYGWIRDTGIGTMLKYCDRVVHDRWHESDSSEWRVKIGRLLMNGYKCGSVVLTDIPSKVRKYMTEASVGDDLSPTRIKLEYQCEY